MPCNACRQAQARARLPPATPKKWRIYATVNITSSAARAGAARTYVELDHAPTEDAGYRAWIEGVRSGRVYFGDGRSHFIDYRIEDTPASARVISLERSKRVRVVCRVACHLEPAPFDLEAQQRRDNSFTYWHIERARLGSSRNVPLEVIVNGQVVERRELLANGEMHEIATDVAIERSGWVALRILPSGHTAPAFVLVDGAPVRASRRSARWCLECVEVLWRNLSGSIRASERDEAAEAWRHALETYGRILEESKVE